MRHLRLHAQRSGDGYYYHVWITTPPRQHFFPHIHDKRRFMECVSRSLTGVHRLTVLAYSLVPSGAHFLLYASNAERLDRWANKLADAYDRHLLAKTSTKANTVVIFDRLAGRHEALAVSRDIHLLPTMWRRNPYSSIRCYLDDAKIEWLNPERMFQLFDHNPTEYLRFLRARRTESDRIFTFTEMNQVQPSTSE